MREGLIREGLMKGGYERRQGLSPGPASCLISCIY
jgi:hypothetical protein